ncbi:DNA-processing protein DprA [Solimicrobium silvestre]|uniref:DprA: DNA protecting protein DprA n=1 Tax=Solimicrobium silvestre TaxID=2099400 RepID=A0A2S9H3D1_9BURK|nr:DNA-processing protein DprA [Solimicrobium silvestre]PRC94481.1 dprA: DNA protecting protein DprA [Solimicrobium silvestre]
MSDVSDWIRLTATPGIGCEAARKLLLEFGLPDQIFSASYAALKQVVSERQAKALCEPPTETILALIERTHLWCAEPNNFLITLADNNYPTLLLEIPDPPTLLYVKGRIELLSNTSIAVVGSRNASTQGSINAKQFSSNLSQSGLTIVSGMALGIDTAAHEGGLESLDLTSGSTIAVIGTGADIVYPARNRGLAHKIAEHGCIVSEYALGTPAIASNFPRRNRLISGLSQGVLVIEAAAQSGSLITARMALEQGRDVFAIPGSIHSPLAKGCHLLIKQGAKLVETAQDILQELRLDTLDSKPEPAQSMLPFPSNTNNEIETEAESELLIAIGYDPIHPDVLAQRCNVDSGELSAKLLMLELDGHVEVLAGGLYRRLG